MDSCLGQGRLYVNTVYSRLNTLPGEPGGFTPGKCFQCPFSSLTAATPGVPARSGDARSSTRALFSHILGRRQRPFCERGEATSWAR